MNRRLLSSAIRILLGAVLIWAAVGKLLAPAAFFSQLTDYQVRALPIGVWQLIAVGLPWFEAVCGLALIANVWPETVRPVVVVLFAGFVAMLLQAVVRGLDLNCGSFGGAPGWFDRPGVALVRAILLLGLAVAETLEGNLGPSLHEKIPGAEEDSR